MLTSHHIEVFARGHIDQTVDIHLQAFPEFFLSSLGPRFLREFYASFLVDPAGMGFVACGRGGQILGAVVGPLNPRGYFKRLLRRRWWAFGLASLNIVVRNPLCLRRIARAVLYRGEPPSGANRALLSSVAVSPSAQGRGVGKALVIAWIEEARRRGASGCYLTTDAERNDGVNEFYRRMGWMLESSYITPEGRRMSRYVHDFPRATDAAGVQPSGRTH
jgi:GNAT superfamily N-acetyltransferase